ncbi:MAG: arsenic resistance protein [Candidatus Lokiarchaeota archaeon]|nr:arsenic resistance protein [Candidatus Lokiarchaeota archaeon]
MSKQQITGQVEVKEEMGRSINYFEKFLTVWVGVCIVLGIVLSQIIPAISNAIESLQFAGINIPIGICLFLMMYPAMLNLQTSEIRKLGKNPKPIILTLFSNWIIAPSVGFLMARIFLAGYEQLIVAIILLASSPCTAMVLVWGWMCEGNQEQNVVNTTLNTVTIIFLFVPIVALLTGIQNIPINHMLLILSVVLFIGLPMGLGIISKRAIVSLKGLDWFDNTYRPFTGKISMIALLTTLVVLFSLNGSVLLLNPDILVLVSIPILLGFAIVVGFNTLITKIFSLNYREAIITVIIGSSSHFEIAIATAITIYGVGSLAALGTTMGLFWEVPIMLGLVYLGKYLGKKGFWKWPEKALEACEIEE